MTYKYQPSFGPGGSDEISLHFQIHNKRHKITLSRVRFERTVEQIDGDIEKGMSFNDICKKYATHIVKTDEPEVQSAPTAKADKRAIIEKIIAENPHFSLGEVSQAASKTGAMTYANARYLASSLLNLGK
jgi:hypothetical protein